MSPLGNPSVVVLPPVTQVSLALAPLRAAGLTFEVAIESTSKAV